MWSAPPLGAGAPDGPPGKGHLIPYQDPCPAGVLTDRLYRLPDATVSMERLSGLFGQILSESLADTGATLPGSWPGNSGSIGHRSATPLRMAFLWLADGIPGLMYMPRSGR